MSIEAELHDGRVLEFPDGTDPTVIQSTIKKLLGQPVEPSAAPTSVMEPKPGLMDQLGGAAKSIGSGVAKGYMGVAGMPGDIPRVLDQLGSKVTGKPVPTEEQGKYFFPSSAELGKFYGTDKLHKPQNPVEKYIESGTEGATGMAASGAIRPMALALGLASGLGGQAAEDATGGNNPAARMAGAAAPLVPAAYWAMRKPNAIRTVQGAMGDVSEEALLKADAVRKAAEARLGTKTLLSQGMDSPNPLSAITAELARSPQGETVRKVLDRQLPVGQEKIDELIQSIRGRQPSPKVENDILAAGKSAMAEPAIARAEATRPYYAAARGDEVDPVQVDQMLAALDAVASKHGFSKGSASGNVIARTKKQVGNLEPGDTNALQVDNLKREAAMRTTNPNLPPERKKAYQEVANVLRETAQDSSDNLKQGAAVHGALSKWMVEPMEQSAMGRMFPETTRQSGVGNFDEMSRIFDTTKFSPHDVRFAANNLNRMDPQAWPDLVRQHLESAAKASSRTVEGRTPQNTLETFVNAVESPNFTEAIKGVAKAHGEDPRLVADGADKLMSALRVISRERGSVGQVDVGEFAKNAGANLGSSASRNFNFIQPFRGLGRAIEARVHDSTYKAIADALTSPDGVKKLIELNSYSVGEERLLAAVRALITTSAVQAGAN